MPKPCQVKFERDLYHGYTASFFHVLAQVDQSPALVLGHNPGIAMFANAILREAPRHHDFLRYPTASTLVCDFPVSRWEDAAAGIAEPVDFVIPRELV